MRIARLDTCAVSIACTRVEHSLRIRCGGVTEVIVHSEFGIAAAACHEPTLREGPFTRCAPER